MTITVLTLWDEHYAEVGAISGPNKRAYAARHGYDFMAESDRLDPARPTAWSKIALLRRQLPHCNWAFWTDADSLIMNGTLALEDLVATEADLILTHDHYGLNTGQFLVRNTAWSADFLAEVYAQIQFVDHPWWEQAALAQVLERQPHSAWHVAYIDQRRLNAYPSNYRPGDFLIHFAGLGRDLPYLLQTMRAWSAAAESALTPL
jgi:hypothetical protein